jgi:hypothetical protein
MRIPKLARAFTDAAGDQGMNADGGEEQRQAAQRGNQQHHDPLPRQRLGTKMVDAANGRQGQLRIDAGHRHPECRIGDGAVAGLTNDPRRGKPAVDRAQTGGGKLRKWQVDRRQRIDRTEILEAAALLHVGGDADDLPRHAVDADVLAERLAIPEVPAREGLVDDGYRR